MRPTVVVVQGRARRGMGAAASVLGSLVMALAGCGTAAPGTSAVAVDCTTQVRLDGVVYAGVGHRGRPVAPVGAADVASCDDMGVDAAGSFFLDDPEQVAAWSVRGFSPDEVLAVRWRHDRVELFVAERLTERDRARVLRRLRQDDDGSGGGGGG